MYVTSTLKSNFLYRVWYETYIRSGFSNESNTEKADNIIAAIIDIVSFIWTIENDNR